MQTSNRAATVYLPRCNPESSGAIILRFVQKSHSRLFRDGARISEVL